MIVPGVLPKWCFTCAWTAGVASWVIAKHALGDPKPAERALSVWARTISKSWGLEVEATGLGHIEANTTYVFMANHQSYADVIALATVLPQAPGFLAKKELRKIPFLGTAMKAAGHVFIDRGDRSRALDAIAEAAEQVRSGSSIVIFPEGTRGETGVVAPFKKGGFHLARQAGVPIVPIGIQGTPQVLPKRGGRIQPGHVRVHVGAPIVSNADEPLDALIARVHAEIRALCA